MEAKAKFKLKKQIKIFLTLAWSMVGFFLLYVTIIVLSGTLFGKPLADVFANLFGTESKSPIVLLTVIALLVIPLVGGMIFTMLSTSVRQQLYSYRKSIHLYRSRKFCQKILELLILGETQKAVDLYKVTKMYEDNLDDYLYGVIITECRLSNDEALKKIGEAKTAKLLNAFNPDKIKF